MSGSDTTRSREPRNRGKLVGQKRPLKVRDIWAIRVRLQLQGRIRDLALLNLGIDSKLRRCDLVNLRVRDVCHCDRVSPRAMVMQQKTHRRCNSRSRLPHARGNMFAGDPAGSKPKGPASLPDPFDGRAEEPDG